MLDYIKAEYWNVFVVFNYIVAVSAIITILLKSINPNRTVPYIVLLVLFPFLGLLVYYLFGQEYRKNKIFNRKNILNQSIIKSIKKDVQFNSEEIKRVDDYLGDKVKLVKLLYNDEYAPLTLKNDVSIINNGNDLFSRLIKDIKEAKHHIHLEYYTLMDDTIGKEIMGLLCEKSKSGVEVRLSYDDVGSKISSKMKRKMDKNGVMHFPFMPVVFNKFTGKMNYRNHRKIAIIDGTVAYVGGMNISDEYLNNKEDDSFWRDTHLRIIGEAIKSLQIHFFTTWSFVSNSKVEIDKSYFPEIACEKNVGVQIAASGPDTDWANIMESILTAITLAKKYVYITTPYFVPNLEILTAMQMASRSGVDVRLIIPKNSDSWVTKHATNSYLESLLLANVKVYHYTKGFVHAKTMVVDDIFSTVGTSNMDYRSFYVNFEVNAFIYDIDKSKTLKQHFYEDLGNSELIDRERWLSRSKLQKAYESYSRLWAALI
tara:strand:- start:55740 stop:57194 length:1455 start_codon:yes stop_codon:yes gene_type:complete